MIEGYEELVRQHLPTGYKVTRRMLKKSAGLTVRQRQLQEDLTYKNVRREIIISSEFTDRDALFIFLHECGHIHMGHIEYSDMPPLWRQEYEADQYAIYIMRQAKIPVPRHWLKNQKELMRKNIEESDEQPEAYILQYAYGKEWRKHQ